MSGEPARPGRALVLAAALAFAPAVGAAETLFDAIQLAYQTNPALRAQRAQLRAIDEGYVQARAGLGPQVSVNGQAAYDIARIQQPAGFFSPATDQTFRSGTGSVDLSVVQPLFASGALKAQVAGAAASVLAGRQGLRQAESQLIQGVVTAYMDVRRDRETIRILKDQIGNLSAEFDEAKAKAELGQLTKTDVAEAQSQLLSAQAQLNLAMGRLNASDAEYLAVVGQSPGELAPEPDLPGMPATVDQAFDAAEHNNPDLLGAIETEKAAREKVRQAKAAYGPTVSLRLDAAAQPLQPYLQNQYNRSLTGAVVFSQPLFTSGMTGSKVREAADRDTQALLDIEAKRRTVVQQVAEAWSQLAFTRGALQIQARQVEAARTSVEGNQIEERVGLRSIFELLAAELQLANSRVNLVQGRHDEYVARATLLAAMGVLEARFLTPNTEIYDPTTPLKAPEANAGPPWEGFVAGLDAAAGAHAAAGRPSPPGAGAQRPADLPPLPTDKP